MALVLTLVGLTGPAAANPTTSGGGKSALAGRILQATGVRKGICLDLGCGDAALALALAKGSALQVICVDPDERTVQAARLAADAAGLYGRRVSVRKDSLAPLNYPDYCANLIVFGDELAGGLRGRDFKEIRRVLNPNGAVFIGQSAAAGGGQRLSRAQLETWLNEAGFAGVQWIENEGLWAHVRGERPAGTDEWGHRLHDPGNTARSADGTVKLPLRLQWFLSPPPAALGSGTMLTAGGRQFIMTPAYETFGSATTPALLALDAYNGTELWSRLGQDSLPAGFFSMSNYSPDLTCSFAAATADSLYVLCGRQCARFDAGGGEILGAWPIPAEANPTEKDVWLYMAVQGDLLVGVAGPSPAFRAQWYAATRRGVATAAFALDRKTGKSVWVKKTEALANSVVLGDDTLFFFDRQFQLCGLEVSSGRERFAVKSLEFSPKAGILYSAYDRGQLWLVYNAKGNPSSTSGNGNGNDLAVFSGKDGKYLFTPDMTKVVINSITLAGDRVYGRGQHGGGGDVNVGWDATTGQRCPTEGMSFGGCSPLASSPNYVLGRAGGPGFYDPATNAFANIPWLKNNCYYPPIPANGLLYVVGPGCRCPYPVRAFAAWVPGPPVQGQAEDPRTRLIQGSAAGDEADGFKTPAVWASWRADATRSGQTAENAKTSLKRLWESELPAAITPLAMADSTVFCGSTDHKLYALDAADGKERWHYIAEGPIFMPPYLWKGRVYVGDGEGWIHCLRARDGAMVWRYRLAPEGQRVIRNGLPISRWPIGAGVLVDKETVYGVSGLVAEAPIMAVALDVASGEPRWETTYPRKANDKYHPVPVGPLVLAQNGSALLPPTHAGGGGMLISLTDSKHGTRSVFGLAATHAVAAGNDLIWGKDAAFAYEPNTPIRYSPDLPIVTEKVVYLVAFSRQSSGLSARSRAALRLRDGQFQPLADRKAEDPPPEGELLWSAWRNARMRTLILAGATLFSGGNEIPKEDVARFGQRGAPARLGPDRMYATSAADGKELWSCEVPGDVRDLAFSGGRLAVQCGPSKVVCFDCTD